MKDSIVAEDPTADRLKNALIQVVDTQIANNDPPETRLTFDRLIEAGYPKEQVYKMIGSVIVSELYSVMEKEEKYSNERYIKALTALPDLPWEKKST